ncbi:hypothetical protein A2U01_0007122, partial [Trifolium medium]|nr:hypothetical protein [Trifolium medium]
MNDGCHGFFLGMRVSVRPCGGWKTFGNWLSTFWIGDGSVQLSQYVLDGICDEKSAVRGPRFLNHSIPKTTSAPSMGNSFCGDMKVGCDAGLENVVGAAIFWAATAWLWDMCGGRFGCSLGVWDVLLEVVPWVENVGRWMASSQRISGFRPDIKQFRMAFC